MPCAAIAALAIAFLGAPLGRLLYPSTSPYVFFPSYAVGVHPEPTEQARYLLALGAPVLLAAATVWAARRQPTLPVALVRAGVPLVQLLGAGVLVACFVAQAHYRFGRIYTGIPHHWIRDRYFGPATFAGAALVVAAVVGAIRLEPLHRRLATWLRPSPGRALGVGASAVAIAFTLVWLTHAINSDASVGLTTLSVRYHVAFHLDETFAVLNGLTPLVDFTAQYGSLWPYVVALPMLAFGKTLLTFTIVMSSLTALAMLAIFDVLRRVTRNAVAALLLYLPFLATSFLLVEGTLGNRFTYGNYFAAFPLRYAGPYFLAWLTARRLQRGGRWLWALFLAAGLVILNNVDYGIPALGATVAALVWTTPSLRPRPLLRLGASVAAGLALALALVSLLTLLRAGALPQLGRLVEFARLYTAGGFAAMPIPGVLGLHLVIFLTYVGAIGTATVRAIGGADDRVLTGMLAWSGVFGLGSATYYVGRSHPEALVATFSVWALTLALLAVVVVRALARTPTRRPTIAALAVLGGMGIATCTLVQTPLPWAQIERVANPDTAREAYSTPIVPPEDPQTRAFVSSLAYGPRDFAIKPGAPVALLMAFGHRVADAYGVKDVVPYTGPDSVETTAQLDRVIEALRKAGGNTIILPFAEVDYKVSVALWRRGFKLVTPQGLRSPDVHGAIGNAAVAKWFDTFLIKWVDAKRLYPKALRAGG